MVLVSSLVLMEMGSFTVLNAKLEDLFVVKYVCIFIQVHSQLSMFTYKISIKNLHVQFQSNK